MAQAHGQGGGPVRDQRDDGQPARHRDADPPGRRRHRRRGSAPGLLRGRAPAPALSAACSSPSVGRGGFFTARRRRGRGVPEGLLVPRARRSSRSRTPTTARAAACGRQRRRARVAERARSLGLATHLDGARIWNASVACGRRRRDAGARRSTRRACASRRASARPWAARSAGRASSSRRRGGSASAGAAPCGSRASSRRRRCTPSRTIARAWPTITRARARSPRGSRARPGRRSTSAAWRPTSSTSTSRRPPTPWRATRRSGGVLINATGPQRLRAVTHLDVSREDIDAAADILAGSHRRRRADVRPAASLARWCARSIAALALGAGCAPSRGTRLRRHLRGGRASRERGAAGRGARRLRQGGGDRRARAATRDRGALGGHRRARARRDAWPRPWRVSMRWRSDAHERAPGRGGVPRGVAAHRPRRRRRAGGATWSRCRAASRPRGVGHVAVRRLVDHADEQGPKAGLDELAALEHDLAKTELAELMAYLSAEHLEALGDDAGRPRRVRAHRRPVALPVRRLLRRRALAGEPARREARSARAAVDDLESDGRGARDHDADGQLRARALRARHAAHRRAVPRQARATTPRRARRSTASTATSRTRRCATTRSGWRPSLWKQDGDARTACDAAGDAGPASSPTAATCRAPPRSAPGLSRAARQRRAEGVPGVRRRADGTWQPKVE